MLNTEKTCLNAKNSTVQATSAHETCTPPRGKQFDFSEFNKYFNESVSPSELVKGLQEIRASYLEMSLHALMADSGMNPIRISPCEDIQNHTGYLLELIKLVGNLQP